MTNPIDAVTYLKRQKRNLRKAQAASADASTAGYGLGVSIATEDIINYTNEITEAHNYIVSWSEIASVGVEHNEVHVQYMNGTQETYRLGSVWVGDKTVTAHQNATKLAKRWRGVAKLQQSLLTNVQK